MRRLNFSKPKARKLFDAYKAKTRTSYSQMSDKLNMSASYLSSILKDDRSRPSDHSVYAMAKLLKVDVAALCEELQEDEQQDFAGINAVIEDDEDFIVVLKGSTLRMFRDPLASAEKRKLEIRPLGKSSLQVKRLLEEAISLL